MRHALPVLLLLLVSGRAEAAPFLATFEGAFGSGPAADTLFTANFFFDAPTVPPNAYSGGYAEGVWPISLLLLNVGGSQVLSQVNPGLNFYGLPSMGFVGAFWQVPAQALPAGYVFWSLSADPNFIYQYSTPNGVVGAGGLFSNIAITPLSIPEPAAAVVALTGALLLWRRR